jgi:Holliday junction resolvasome RuvABC ATP-dependent DNA helicase subunit
MGEFAFIFGAFVGLVIWLVAGKELPKNPHGFQTSKLPVPDFGVTYQHALLFRTQNHRLIEHQVFMAEIDQIIQDINLAPADEEPLEDLDVLGEIAFKPDEPTSLEEFDGQRHIVRPLQLAMKALPSDARVLTHKLMTGMAGLGKTLLAKVIANDLRNRAAGLGLGPVHFIETYAANLNSVAALDEQARRLVNKGGIWFIDEIHVLNKELATKLYLLMEDGRYPFEGSANPTAMPDVMVIGATTDYGSLHAALKRRFGEPLMVRALTRAELLAMVDKLGFAITAEAADLLVSRCWQSGAPYELKILFREATIFATANGLREITVEVVDDVFDTYEIDVNGLRPVDRSVITALFMRPRYRGKDQAFYCFGGSESDVCAVAKLDKAEFQESIRPKLMSRGLLEVRAGVGLALTELAVKEYSHLSST